LTIMNLEDLGLVELNVQESQEINGGGLFTFIALGLLIIGVGLVANSNSKNVNGPGGSVSSPPGNTSGFYKGNLLTSRMF
ncbi:MAG: hypothetical protein ABI850_15250, partial [Flavobacterium sp.]